MKRKKKKHSKRNKSFFSAQELAGPAREVHLADGDLLLLTGAARWEYLHRVLPTEVSQSATRVPGERVSLVWGVW